MTAAIAQRAVRQGRWLITLADLSLLLVGFMVAVRAGERHGPAGERAINASLHAAFGGTEPVALGVDAMRFAPGTATPLDDPAALVAWARDAAGDPRSRLRITAHGSGAEGLVLGARRAAAVAGMLARALPPARIGLAVDEAGGVDQVDVTVSFEGRP